jgi:hypothetical protein
MPADEVLIVAKGVSQGRAVHTACYLARRGANVTMATGPGPVRAIFAPDFLDEPNVMVTELPMKPDHSRQDIADLMSSQKWDLIMSAGPDIQHRMISTLASEFAPEARLAYTNNALMCCGEGICGACETAIGESQVRVCKGMPDTEMITF